MYQTTSKTCKLFDSPNSYYRKKHEPPYTIRSLIKQHFLFEICTDFYPNIISSNEDSIALLEDCGFSKEDLPRKYNNGDFFTHIEEYILNLQNESDKLLLCPTTNEEVLSQKGGIVFTYIDKYQSNPFNQLYSLINRYNAILIQHKAQISFLIITDSELRERSYRKAIKHFLRLEDQNSTQTIPSVVINFHISILQSQFGFEGDKLIDFERKVIEKYTSPRPISKEDYEGLDLDAIKAKRVKEIERLTSLILNNQEISSDQKYEKIRSFFIGLYKLYGAGKLSANRNFELSIYRIGRKFSL